MLRAPDGTPLRPDVVWFNFGLHNLNENTRRSEYGLRNYVSDFSTDLDGVTRRLVSWAARKSPPTQLIFGLTTPFLFSSHTDDVIQQHNVRQRRHPRAMS